MVNVRVDGDGLTERELRRMCMYGLNSRKQQHEADQQHSVDAGARGSRQSCCAEGLHGRL